MFRDGRDVMVSWYHHCLFPNDRFNQDLVERERSRLRFVDYHDIEKNLPVFIEYVFKRQAYPRFSWAEFVRSWHGDEEVCHVKYEALLADASSEIERLILELMGERPLRQEVWDTVERFSFRRLSGREPGQENKSSFLRKGKAGDWKEHFTSEACQVFDFYAGNELILLGYEKDHHWVTKHAVGT